MIILYLFYMWYENLRFDFKRMIYDTLFTNIEFL